MQRWTQRLALAIVFSSKKILEPQCQFGEIVGRHSPHPLDLDLIIAVDEDIPHRLHLRPRQEVGVHRTKFWRQAARSFTDNSNLMHHRRLGELIVIKILRGDAPQPLADFGGGLRNLAEGHRIKLLLSVKLRAA